MQGDTRYNEEAAAVVTHDHSEMRSIPVLRLEEVENAAWHVDVIAIDEGQFLPGEKATLPAARRTLGLGPYGCSTYAGQVRHRSSSLSLACCPVAGAC